MKHYQKYKTDYLGEYENDILSEEEWYQYLREVDFWYWEMSYVFEATEEEIQNAFKRTQETARTTNNLIKYYLPRLGGDSQPFLMSRR